MSTAAPDAAGVPELPAPTTGDGAQIVGKTPWQLFWGRFKKDRFALAGLALIVLLVLMAIFAPLFAALVGHGPNELFQRETTDIFGIPNGPTSSFWFGADNNGRTSTTKRSRPVMSSTICPPVEMYWSSKT